MAPSRSLGQASRGAADVFSLGRESAGVRGDQRTAVQATPQPRCCRWRCGEPSSATGSQGLRSLQCAAVPRQRTRPTAHPRQIVQRLPRTAPQDFFGRAGCRQGSRWSGRWKEPAGGELLDLEQAAPPPEIRCQPSSDQRNALALRLRPPPPGLRRHAPSAETARPTAHPAQAPATMPVTGTFNRQPSGRQTQARRTSPPPSAPPPAVAETGWQPQYLLPPRQR